MEDMFKEIDTMSIDEQRVYFAQQCIEITRTFEKKVQNTVAPDPKIKKIIEILEEHDFGGFKEGVVAVVGAIIKDYTGIDFPGLCDKVNYEYIERSSIPRYVFVVPLEQIKGSCYETGETCMVRYRGTDMSHEYLLRVTARTGNDCYGSFRFATNEEIEEFFKNLRVVGTTLKEILIG